MSVRRSGSSIRTGMKATPQASAPLFEAAPCITAVHADPKDPNLRRIKVGRRTVATLSAVATAELGITEGAPWDKALSATVQKHAALDTVRRDALKALARASVSRARLATALERRGHSVDLVAQVLAGLVADGWLDDRKVAEEAARSIQRKGRLPRSALAQKLTARGLDEVVALEAAGAGAAPGVEEREACLILARSLLARQQARTSPRPAQRLAVRPEGQPAGSPRSELEFRRLASALARRGFDADIIASVLESMGVAVHPAAAPEDDPAPHRSPSPGARRRGMHRSTE